MTQTEKSRAVVQRYLAAMDEGKLDAACDLVAEGLVNHAAIPEAQGRAGLRVIADKVREAFPDARFRVHDVIADGDRVAVRLTFTGTHTGPLRFVRIPLPATGRHVEVDHVHVFRVDGERIVEHWGLRDDLVQLRQLGIERVPGT